MVSLRLVGVVIVLVFAAVVLFALFRGTQLQTREEVVKFVIDDLQSDKQIPAGDRLFTIFSANYSNETGQWTAVAKITLNPHYQCPTVFIRAYQLLPIRHEPDRIVTQNCGYGNPIAFVEEAIIASRPVIPVSQQQNAYACGYHVPLDANEALAYCPDADLQKLQSFASSTPETAWIAEWRYSSTTTLVALNEMGVALNTTSYPS